MADERFFRKRHHTLRLIDIASRMALRLNDEARYGARTITGLATLGQASSTDISFFDNKKYLSAFQSSRAGACIVTERFASHAPQGMALLFSDTPYLAYAQLSHLFYAERQDGWQDGVHPSALIEDNVTLAAGCVVAAGACIGYGARLGEGCLIGAHAVLGEGVVLGAHCVLASHVSLSHALVGNRVHIHAGARIGQEGFGFALDGRGGYHTVLQLGRVIIGDDVVIGANTTIDRGSLQDTEIGAHCRIDNLVHIAHNVVLGKGCVLAGQVGISGSTRFGDYCRIGGQVGFSGHSHIGSNVEIAAKSGVMRDVATGERIAGIPAVPIRQWHRQTVALQQLAGRKQRRQ